MNFNSGAYEAFHTQSKPNTHSNKISVWIRK